ncbi:hypothetical protein Y032_0063g3430 [Ancylostoma ceylanicum]|uniref:Uncharacterized protein n=1 Tax=Ancylostoma ceylanicum TaxID=53326 RepID=A0A016U1D6_9BILA|nr:hypothetical protein Y032_0063g3430 [Ancylostoma ceylanicum]
MIGGADRKTVSANIFLLSSGLHPRPRVTFYQARIGCRSHAPAQLVTPLKKHFQGCRCPDIDLFQVVWTKIPERKIWRNQVSRPTFAFCVSQRYVIYGITNHAGHRWFAW